MTVGELKKLLEQFDDDLEVEVKDDIGYYDTADEVHEEEDTYCEYEECVKTKKDILKRYTKKVVRIY